MMQIISFKKLKEFFNQDQNAKTALQDWHKTIKKAEWENFADIKKTFNSVDCVGNGRYVFNVKGNQYRVVAIVRFSHKRVLIRWVGNHEDYNKIKNISEL